MRNDCIVQIETTAYTETRALGRRGLAQCARLCFLLLTHAALPRFLHRGQHFPGTTAIWSYPGGSGKARLVRSPPSSPLAGFAGGGGKGARGGVNVRRRTLGPKPESSLDSLRGGLTKWFQHATDYELQDAADSGGCAEANREVGESGCEATAWKGRARQAGGPPGGARASKARRQSPSEPRFPARRPR